MTVEVAAADTPLTTRSPASKRIKRCPVPNSSIPSQGRDGCIYATQQQGEAQCLTCEATVEESVLRGNVVSMNCSKLRAAASPPSPACLPRSRLHSV